MKVRILIIGVGQFGNALAMRLVESGAEVTIVDPRRDRVDRIAPHVAQAIVADASDPAVLDSLDPTSFDVAVDAIGEENLEASIFCAALLCQAGVQRVIARVITDLHGRILKALGVHEILHPENRLAADLAQRLVSPGIAHRLALEDGVEVVEWELQEAWIGRSLRELDLRQRFAVNVIGIRRPKGAAGGGFDPAPDPSAALVRGDMLLCIGTTKAVQDMVKELRS